jgi:hypothetical protein
MTPKEYANFIFLEHLETLKPLGIIGSPAKKTAKRNLVITINEILKSHYKVFTGVNPTIYKHYEEVKEEINNL